MKALLAALMAVLAFLPILAPADTYVKGYYRSNGTYVQPYYRSSPDRSYNNNWSVSPNVNPYTGKSGTLQPSWNDRPPQRNNNSYPYQRH